MAAVGNRVGRECRPKPGTADLSAARVRSILVVAGTRRAERLASAVSPNGLDTTLARKGDTSDSDEADAGSRTSVIWRWHRLLRAVTSPSMQRVYRAGPEARPVQDRPAFIVPVRDLVEVATSRVVLEQRAIHQAQPMDGRAA